MVLVGLLPELTVDSGQLRSPFGKISNVLIGLTQQYDKLVFVK